MILIVDFGSQTAHLIGRRILDLGAQAALIDPDDALVEIAKHNPAGIILSGGPSSVYEKDAPTINPKIFSHGIPVLGICYGWQLMAKLLGGNVASSHKEYGPVSLQSTNYQDLLYGLPDRSQVFESHGDSVLAMPKGFEI